MREYLFKYLKFHPLSHFFQLKIFYTAWANEWQFKKLHRHWFCSSCWHPASCQFLSSHVQWVPVIEFQQAKVTCMLAWNWATKMSYFEKPKCMRHPCWWRSFCTSSQVYKSLWIVRIMISRFPQADLLSSQFTAYHWGGVVLMVNFDKSHVYWHKIKRKFVMLWGRLTWYFVDLWTNHSQLQFVEDWILKFTKVYDLPISTYINSKFLQAV